MKVESIVFNCPFMRKGSVDSCRTQRIIAPSIDHYFRSNDVFKADLFDVRYKQIFLIAVKFNDDLFIVQKSNKQDKLIKLAKSLSYNLNSTFVVIKVSHNDDNDTELEVIFTADNSCEETTSTVDDDT